MNERQADDDRRFLKHLVRVLIQEEYRTWKSRKRSLQFFRQSHIDITGLPEVDVDSTIKEVLSEYSCKIQKRMNIKKPY